MSDRFFDLFHPERRDALRFAEAQGGRPDYLLEKDIWVVWSLSALFGSPLAEHLTFKGGTSLSKVYRAIDRFSEDVDVTYDIRKLIPELAGEGDAIPSSTSQGRRWTDEVKRSLPGLLTEAVKPMIEEVIGREGLTDLVRVEMEAGEGKAPCLLVHYEQAAESPDYVKPWVRLEFGARATGEPHELHDVGCDADGLIPGLVLPNARPQVMRVERTFWEKATAAHVFCAKKTFRGDGERFSRHWFDLASIYASGHFQAVRESRSVALDVAQHKNAFFREKDADQKFIDYVSAVEGGLRLVPDGKARRLLQDDYGKMVSSSMIFSDPPSFGDMMDICETMADELNSAVGHQPPTP